MIELRDYQKDLLTRVQLELQPDNVRVMMQLPTGGGKTVIAAHLLNDWLVNGRKAVWLTHRRELARQTRKMLSDTAGVRVWLANKWKPGKPAQSLSEGVIILMAQTVSKHSVAPDVWSKYDHRDMMIIDEAHHATAEGYTRAMKCWPGRIVGMTATPWRLSQKEGFDHLFDSLVCGPQVTDLRLEGFLCEWNILVPDPEERIQGGEIGSIGDYTEGGIERANQEHIMTAGVLEFWKNYAQDRQTIVYAVSVRHARNIEAIFRSAGIPIGIMLGDTPPKEREMTISRFDSGMLRVLVNVIVATEGFDLPDASCVVIARPTQSLALYLQMLGRGLRPKLDGGDCLILDLAGNSITHGLPEQYLEWSLAPRGRPPGGEAPVAWCEHCGVVSPAASHNCQFCGAPFGEDCQRCGKWRSRSRWILRYRCEYAHDIVCDRCHLDAHLQNHLPVTTQMELLAKLDDGDEEMTIDDRLTSLLRELLEEERRRATGSDEDRRSELRESIKKRYAELSDESVLNNLFEEYLSSFPVSRRPQTIVQKYGLYTQWERNLRAELANKRNELADLENKPVDSRAVFTSSQDRVLSLLTHEAEALGLFSYRRSAVTGVSPQNRSLRSAGWIPLTDTKFDPTGKTPALLKFPSGEDVAINSWSTSLVEIANWLIRKGKLSRKDCPVPHGKAKKAKICLINTTPYHPNGGKRFAGKRDLLDGMYINTNFNAKNIFSHSSGLLHRFGEDPSQFHIKLK